MMLFEAREVFFPSSPYPLQSAQPARRLRGETSLLSPVSGLPPGPWAVQPGPGTGSSTGSSPGAASAREAPPKPGSSPAPRLRQDSIARSQAFQAEGSRGGAGRAPGSAGRGGEELPGTPALGRQPRVRPGGSWPGRVGRGRAEGCGGLLGRGRAGRRV